MEPIHIILFIVTFAVILSIIFLVILSPENDTKDTNIQGTIGNNILSINNQSYNKDEDDEIDFSHEQQPVVPVVEPILSTTAERIKKNNSKLIGKGIKPVKQRKLTPHINKIINNIDAI